MNPVRILHYLGGIAPETNLLSAIQAGLPSNAVLELAGRVGVTRTVILKKLDISESTMARRSRAKSRLTPQESDRLVRIARVFAYATEVFGSEEKASQWLRLPIRALNFTTPFEYLDTEEGARQVEAVLSHLEHGVFS